MSERQALLCLFLNGGIMDKIKIINPNDDSDYFEIPYEWLPQGTQGPTLSDLESKASRSIFKAKLYRVRSGEVPAATLDVAVRLSQKELYPLLRLLKLVKIKIYFFEKYLNKFITMNFYAEKPNPKWHSIPENNNTDNIIYEPFTINFAGYESE